ncbi:hypothetical protein [Gandjariella thermophila]|uniref:hypothetical protein n=1 Tax=Gandjariella thermophila TaxID=1931992 RepID=UPI001CEF6CE2|nr:hypothetical protein [Gandjariella thermophila]
MAAVLLAVLVGACGGRQGGQVGPGAQLPVAPPSSSSTPAAVPPAPNGGVPVTQSQVNAAALPAEYPRKVWTEGDGRTLVAYGQEGGCGKVRADLAEQSATTVRIVFVETVPKVDRPCTMDLRYPPLTVRLDQPLGSRTVVLQSRTDKV